MWFTSIKIIHILYNETNRNIYENIKNKNNGTEKVFIWLDTLLF